MALSSSFNVYLSNVFHPATFFVLFTFFLLIDLVLLEAVAFAIIAATLTFLLHRLTPLHPPPPTPPSSSPAPPAASVPTLPSD